MKSPTSHVFAFAFLLLVVLTAAAAIFLLWIENQKLAAKPELAPVVFYKVEQDKTFLDETDANSYGEEGFWGVKKKLEEEKRDFIFLDLKEMNLILYEGGKPARDFKIQSKGKEGSWWETSTGIYSVASKKASHFSSISQVWMPYGIQFYGNFFIHGWPYYSGGAPLPPGSSGGCIRLLTEDARVVYEFAKTEMPVLVFEEKPKLAFLPAIRAVRDEISAPRLGAEMVLAGDLDTGEILIGKNSDSVFSIASLVKIMTALVASEAVYLEKTITAQPFMFVDLEDGGAPVKTWTRYRAFDLLYPLLTQSSDGAAKTLSYFLGEDNFVAQMNKKAAALNMNETVFADAMGKSERNVSSLNDLTKLMKYVLEKRSFLLGISRGLHYADKGIFAFSNIENKNPLYAREGAVGVISGKAAADSKESVLSVWNLKTRGGVGRNLFIGIIESENGEEDLKEILDWLRVNFGIG